MSRRGRKEPRNFGVGGESNSRHKTVETGPKRTVEKNHVPSKVTKVDQVHVRRLKTPNERIARK